MLLLYRYTCMYIYSMYGEILRGSPGGCDGGSEKVRDLYLLLFVFDGSAKFHFDCHLFFPV